MIKYYKNGFTIFKTDTDKNEIISVTNHPENKGIVYSFGAAMIAQSMADSLSSQVGILRPGGVMTSETTEEDYLLNRDDILEHFASASINI